VKVHSETKLTCALKNLMGVNFDRQFWHTSPDLHQCIADLATQVRAQLTIVDAQTILTTNGPKGPGKTKQCDSLILSTDPVAADAYAATLLGLQPRQIAYLTKAAASGVGQYDLSKVTIKKV
jgi:uncharacterized protein (DUF362 family)